MSIAGLKTEGPFAVLNPESPFYHVFGNGRVPIKSIYPKPAIEKSGVLEVPIEGFEIDVEKCTRQQVRGLAKIFCEGNTRLEGVVLLGLKQRKINPQIRTDVVVRVIAGRTVKA